MSTNAKKDIVTTSTHEALRQSEQRSRALIEKSTDAIVLITPEGIITYVSPSTERVTGYTPEEFIGLNGFTLLHPDDLEYVTQQIASILNTPGHSVTFEYRLRHKNGSWRWMEGTATNLLEYPGVGAIVGNYRDITERKQAETEQVQAREQSEELAHQLEKERERLQLAQKSASIGTFEWFIQENKIIWTSELEALYGLPPGGFEGKYENWRSRVHPADIQSAEENLWEAVRGGPPYHVEFRVIWPDDSLHWVLARGDIYYDKNNQLSRMVGVNIDITERKELEQRKDEFISMASHELKTPITSLKGFTHILQRRFTKHGDEQALQYLARIDKQVNKLTKLITDLLDISKIQAGKLEYQEERFDLDALIQEIVENLQETTQTHSLLLEGQAHVQVFGDKDRIGQVLINLLTNAIKYSPKADKVIVRVCKDSKNALVSVQDFGIGIAEVYQKKIFERFYQITDSEEKTYPGLGIGLYISNEIIKRQGGGMWLESKKGEGATFHFALPLATEE